MGVGLFGGRALRKDDILSTHNDFAPFNLEARERENPIFRTLRKLVVRVTLGTNEDSFTQKGLIPFKFQL